MLDKIKEDLLVARKEKNELVCSILRLVISEYELEINRGNNPNIENTIKKIIQSNNETIKVAEVTKADNLIIHLNKENEILNYYLPNYISDEEIQQHIHNINLELNFNKNMGLAMRYFKENKINVEASSVKRVLETILVDS